MSGLQTLTDTDWPTLPVCTRCQGDILPRHQYAIEAGLYVVCAPCLGKPAEAPAPERTGKPRPTQDRPLGTSLPAGQWSLSHACCQECGKRDRPHAGNGLCARCYRRKQGYDRRQAERKQAARKTAVTAAVPVTLPEPETAERVHTPFCPCFVCSERRAQAGAQPRAVDWRGVPFAEATTARRGEAVS